MDATADGSSYQTIIKQAKETIIRLFTCLHMALIMYRVFTCAILVFETEVTQL